MSTFVTCARKKKKGNFSSSSYIFFLWAYIPPPLGLSPSAASSCCLSPWILFLSIQPKRSTRPTFRRLVFPLVASTKITQCCLMANCKSSMIRRRTWQGIPLRPIICKSIGWLRRRYSPPQAKLVPGRASLTSGLYLALGKHGGVTRFCRTNASASLPSAAPRPKHWRTSPALQDAPALSAHRLPLGPEWPPHGAFDRPHHPDRTLRGRLSCEASARSARYRGRAGWLARSRSSWARSAGDSRL
jgi:hypothetical protein